MRNCTACEGVPSDEVCPVCDDEGVVSLDFQDEDASRALDLLADARRLLARNADDDSVALVQAIASFEASLEEDWAYEDESEVEVDGSESRVVVVPVRAGATPPAPQAQLPPPPPPEAVAALQPALLALCARLDTDGRGATWEDVIAHAQADAWTVEVALDGLLERRALYEPVLGRLRVPQKS